MLPAITHKDFFGGNVLVAWPQPTTTTTTTDPTSLLPKFLLSDLGMSEIHPLDDPSDQSDIEVELARIGFAQDYDDLSSTTYFLMTGDESDRRGEHPENKKTIAAEYSPDLLAVAEAIFKYAEDLMSDSRVSLYRVRVFVAEKITTMSLSGWDIDILRAFRNTMLKINDPDPQPMVFESYDALMNAVPRPAGPWDVVRVDPVSFEVLETVSQGHCANKVQLTDREGMPVRVDGTRKVDREGWEWGSVQVSGAEVAMIREGEHHANTAMPEMPTTAELLMLVKGGGRFGTAT